MSAKFFLFPFQVISTLVIILLAEKTVIKTYAIKYSFLNSRQFYADLQPAESRYKVAAKPVPYKPPKPAPSHLEGVTPTLPVVTKSQEFYDQNRNEFAPTVSLAPAVSKPRTKPGSTRDDTSFNSKFKTNKNQGLSKVSLKDFLENKKNQRTSKYIIACGDATISLIEHWPCASEKEALARETYWIEKHPNAVNKVIPSEFRQS